MPFIYIITLIALIISFIAFILNLIQVKKFNSWFFIYFILAFTGAFIGAFLAFGDSPFLLKYNFLNTETISIFISALFVLMGLIIQNKFSYKYKITKNALLIYIGLIIVYIFGVLLANNSNFNNYTNIAINNFNECINAGNPAMENYPRQCGTGNKTFTENIGNEMEKIDLIRINTPRPNQKITSPLIIQGQAKGSWFFEGDFPIVLTNWEGLIIAEGFANAQSDWMTNEFVEFKTELKFIKPEYKNNGTLILQKDNPSDLPEYDDALEIPIYFK